MEKPVVYIIEDNEIMADLVASYIENFSSPKIFHDAYAAIAEIENDKPELIFLDVLLTGPDGFTFLNEIVSYEDTSKIPVAIITSLDLEINKLENYGVKKIFNKTTMKPAEIKEFAKNILEKKYAEQ